MSLKCPRNTSRYKPVGVVCLGERSVDSIAEENFQAPNVDQEFFGYAGVVDIELLRVGWFGYGVINAGVCEF